MKSFLFSLPDQPANFIFLRRATAIILAIAIFAIWPDFGMLYGQNGLVDPELLKIRQGKNLLTIYQIQDFLQSHLLITERQFHHILFILYLGLCLCLLLDFFSRITSFFLILLHGSIFISINQFSYGFDYFCTIALFYCFAFSSKQANLAQRVIQMHMTLVYLFGGFDKLLGHTWRNGEALWKTMHLPYFNPIIPMDIQALGEFPWLWILGAWFIILIELLYLIFIWIPRTRKVYLWLIIAMHLQIALFMGLYLFSAIMICLNLSAFYKKDSPRKTKHSIKSLAQPQNRFKSVVLRMRNTKRKENKTIRV